MLETIMHKYGKKQYKNRPFGLSFGDILEKLVLFDINGTLTDHGKLIARFPASIKKVFGREVSPDSVNTAGKTDSGLSIEFAVRAGVPYDVAEAHVKQLLEVQEAYFRERQINNVELRVMDGVHELLSELAARGHRLGIVTGNTTGIAKMTLEKIGLLDHFEIFSCGERSPSRVDLINHAIVEAGITSYTPMTRGHVTYLGDTPQDVKEGRNAGVQVVGVATGKYSVEALAAETPDSAFENFRDTDAVIRAIETKRIRIGRGYSLWIVPPEPVFSGLKSAITSLSERYGEPAIPGPHITLAGPVADRERFLSASPELLNNIPPLAVTFHDVKIKDGYFRQLCVEARRTTELDAASREAGSAYGTSYSRRYDPHAGVLYSYGLTRGNAVKLMREVRDRLPVPSSFTIETAQLWSTKGPMDTWHQIEEGKLKGKRIRA